MPPSLTPAQADLVLELASAAAAADGVAPLSEQTLLHVRHGSSSPGSGSPGSGSPGSGSPGSGSPGFGSSGFGDGLDWVVASPYDGGIAGYAHLNAPDPSEPDLSGELVVHPYHRRLGVGTALVAALADAADASDNGHGIRIWAHGDRPESAEFAKATGFTRARELWQMLLPMRDLELPPVSLPDGVKLRTFVPGSDEEAWLAVNRRAFADHPEQGRMALTDLAQRKAEPWFDPAGFFLAERPSSGPASGSGEIVGFHWTKVHPDGGTDGGPIGEVYVVGVDPAGQGGGLGKALTIAGLAHLRDRGLSEVMLYVDGDNTPATRLYERLGFTPWHTDVMYSRPGTR